MPYDWNYESNSDIFGSDSGSLTDYSGYIDYPAPSNPPRYIDNICVKALGIIKLLEAVLGLAGGVLLLITLLSGGLGGGVIITIFTLIFAVLLCVLPVMEGIGSLNAIQKRASGASLIAQSRNIFRVVIGVCLPIAVVACFVDMFSSGVLGIFFDWLLLLFTLVAAVVLFNYETCIYDIMVGVSGDLSSGNYSGPAKNMFLVYTVGILVIRGIIFMVSLVAPSLFNTTLSRMVFVNSGALIFKSSVFLFVSFIGFVKSILVCLSYKAYIKNG